MPTTSIISLSDSAPVPCSLSSPAAAQEVKKPSQIKFYRPMQMALMARIVSYPPLGQSSIIPPSRKPFNFTVVLESSTSLPERPWEVDIWLDLGALYGTKAPWGALELKLVDAGPYSLSDDTQSSIHRYCFTGNLDSPYIDSDRTHRGRRVQFTIRYRIDANSEWQWVYHNFGYADGELILQPPIDPNFLGVSPVDVVDGWSARKLVSEAPDARLYSIESSDAIPPAQNGHDAGTHSRVLGRVLNLHRWFALVRIWTPWLGPRHGASKFHLTEPALLISFLRSDGLQVVLLAVNGVDDALTNFVSGEHGEIVVQTRNDTTKDRKFRVLAACAWKFEVALCSVMYELRKQVRSSPAWVKTLEDIPQEIIDQYQESLHQEERRRKGQAPLRADSLSSESDYAMITNAYEQHRISNGNGDKPSSLPPLDTAINGHPSSTSSQSQPQPQYLSTWYDDLGYCTWNGVGQALTADKVLAALDSLTKADVKISTLIIDDNWQSLTGKQGETSQFHRGWKRFEANSEGFPEGLSGLVKSIKNQYPWVKDIAVWHALMGYWGVIAPNSEIAKKYSTQQVHLLDSSPAGGEKLAVTAEAIGQMYADFYAFLSSQGITGVKTDVQFYLDLLTRTSDRRELSTPYLSAWTQAHLRQLSGKAISCMSMTPQILFGQLLPAAGVLPPVVLRTSDDFFPDVETSHPWHIFANAHNGVLVSLLGVVGDWDMFQTMPPPSSSGGKTMSNWTGMHAAARAVSGGPIYITDEPGRHDLALINAMSARPLRKDRGRVILRPCTLGKTVGVYDRYEERGVLKVGVWDSGAGLGRRGELGTGILGIFNMRDGEEVVLLPVSKFPGIDVEDEEGLQGSSRRPSRRGSEYEVSSPVGRSPGGSRPASAGPSSVLGDWDEEDEEEEQERKERKWVIRSHVSGKLTRPVRPSVPLKSEELFLCKLPKCGYDVLTACPVQKVAIENDHQIEVAVFGLLGKFTGACAIVGCDVGAMESGKRVRVGVAIKALGVLGIWVNDPASTGGGERWAKDQMMVMIHGRPIPAECVEVSSHGVEKGDQARMIEIDVEKAWDEMKLDAGYSSEVRVEILFS